MSVYKAHTKHDIQVKIAIPVSSGMYRPKTVYPIVMKLLQWFPYKILYNHITFQVFRHNSL